MSLQEKILKLKLDAAMAARHVSFWEKQIAAYGEIKATEAYTALGLNHLGTKSFDYDGLTLRREPRETEKIAVKGVSQAQESSKEKITTILLELRTELISDGLKGIKKLEPATYHELTLSASSEIRESLRDRLLKVYQQGRLLVASELGRKAATFSISNKPHRYHFSDDELISPCNCSSEEKDAVRDEEFDLLDDLVDLTDSRVINEVQVRIAAAAARHRLLGLTGAAFWKAVEDEVRLGSVSYIDRAATGAANKVISIGRYDEMRDRADDIERYEQSELLDQNTCDPCAADDGKESSNIDDLPGAPNPSCEGGDYCRGFIVAIAEGNM